MNQDLLMKDSVFVGESCHTKYDRLGCLKQQNVFSHGSGGWKPEVKVLADLASEASFLGLPTATFSLCLHTVSPLYVHMSPDTLMCPKLLFL